MYDSKPILEFDERKTRQRILKLISYYRNNVLCGNRFVCKSRLDCQDSVAENLNFYAGQLSHVGKRYDLLKNAKELRIVISGIEYGHPPAKVNTLARRKMILNRVGMDKRYYSNGNHGPRNPHMRGTTLLMRRILLGSESLREYYDWGTEFVGETGQRKDHDHIFNMFALVSFLLCSAVGNDMKGQSSKVMLRRCSAHYLATLEILEPTLVIFQGKGRFKEVLNAAGILNLWQQKSEYLGYFRRNRLEFVTCEFTHPAARNNNRAWGDKPTRPYFKDVVLPTLRQALIEMNLE